MGCCSSKTVDFDEPTWLGHFDLGATVGEGGFAKVQIVTYKQTERQYVLKYSRKSRFSKDRAKKMIRERNILEKLYHPFLVNMMWAFQDDTFMYFVLEYIEGGDLRFHIGQSPSKLPGPDEASVNIWAAELALGINFLHGHGIIHRDLKLDNVLLDLSGHIRITDFNCAALYNGRGHTSRSGTPIYMAPEMVKSDPCYDWAVDWWSLGMMIHEMLFRDLPFPDLRGSRASEDIYRIIRECDVVFSKPRKGLNPSAAARLIIRELLAKEPQVRLGCQQPHGIRRVMAHEWFRGLDWAAVAACKAEPQFRPNPDLANYSMTHSLYQFTGDRSVLEIKRRRDPNRDLSRLGEAQKELEANFLSFDHTQAIRGDMEIRLEWEPSPWYETPRTSDTHSKSQACLVNDPQSSELKTDTTTSQPPSRAISPSPLPTEEMKECTPMPIAV